MSQQTKNRRPCGHVLHTAPGLYVLVRYQPKKDAPDYCRVSCEYLDPDDPTKGSGVSIYLSPFDAYIDAALLSKPGEQYHAIHACEFDPRELIHDNSGSLHYFLHCGWGASNGRLAIRRRGSLARLCGLDTLNVAPDGMHAIDLHIDCKDLERYNRMRESAGLFAHAECHERALALGERQRMQHVAQAIESMPGTVPAGGDVNQMAMYDFEAAQWHFVPIEVFVANAVEREKA